MRELILQYATCVVSVQFLIAIMQKEFFSQHCICWVGVDYSNSRLLLKFSIYHLYLVILEHIIHKHEVETPIDVIPLLFILCHN